MSFQSDQKAPLRGAPNASESKEKVPTFESLPAEVHGNIINQITGELGASQEVIGLVGVGRRFHDLYKGPLLLGRYVDGQWRLLLHKIVLSRHKEKIQDRQTLLGVEKLALEQYPEAECYYHWRDYNPNDFCGIEAKTPLLTDAQNYVRELLLGKPKTDEQENSDPFPEIKQRPANNLPREFSNYTQELPQRYRIVVILLARHFAPANSAYSKQTKTLWLETTGFLFKELRTIMDKNNIKPQELHHDLKFFAKPPTSLEFYDPERAIRRQDFLESPLPDVPLTVFQLALGCHLFNPADAVESAWKHYYQEDRALLLSEIYQLEDLPSKLVDWNYYQLYNTKDGLPRLLKFVFEHLLPAPVGESKVHQGGDNKGNGTGAGNDTGEVVTTEVRWRALEKMRTLRKFQFPPGVLESNLFLQFAHKEKAFTDAMKVLLADVEWCRFLSDHKHLDRLFDEMFFRRRPSQSQEKRPQFMVAWYEFMGGESQLLPLLLDKFGDSQLEMTERLQKLQREGRCLLHSLLVYRAPDTIKKILQLGLKDTINYKHEQYYNCPPLTYIMRQAVRNRNRLHWSFRFDLIVQSIQIMIANGADPLLLDESEDVKDCKLNAIMYASLDSRLKPLLRALLWNEEKKQAGSDDEMKRYYQPSEGDCSAFLKSSGCPFSKTEVLDRLMQDPREQLPELRKYNSEDYLGLQSCAEDPETEYVRREDDVEFDIEQKHKHFPGHLQLSALLDDPTPPSTSEPGDISELIDSESAMQSPPDHPLSWHRVPNIRRRIADRYKYQFDDLSPDPEIQARAVAFGTTSKHSKMRRILLSAEQNDYDRNQLRDELSNLPEYDINDYF